MFALFYTKINYLFNNLKLMFLKANTKKMHQLLDNLIVLISIYFKTNIDYRFVRLCFWYIIHICATNKTIYDWPLYFMYIVRIKNEIGFYKNVSNKRSILLTDNHTWPCIVRPILSAVYDFAFFTK